MIPIVNNSGRSERGGVELLVKLLADSQLDGPAVPLTGLFHEILSLEHLRVAAIDGHPRHIGVLRRELIILFSHLGQQRPALLRFAAFPNLLPVNTNLLGALLAQVIPPSHIFGQADGVGNGFGVVLLAIELHCAGVDEISGALARPMHAVELPIPSIAHPTSDAVGHESEVHDLPNSLGYLLATYALTALARFFLRYRWLKGHMEE